MTPHPKPNMASEKSDTAKYVVYLTINQYSSFYINYLSRMSVKLYLKKFCHKSYRKDYFKIKILVCIYSEFIFTR